MPTYKQVFNGHTMVMRKVQKVQNGHKEQKGGTTEVIPILMSIPVVKTAAKPDQKALRAKLSAELFKTL